MLSQGQLISNITNEAYAFHIATGEIPNVVYVSMYVYRQLLEATRHSFLRVTFAPKLTPESDLSPLSAMEDIYLRIKEHKNEYGYYAVDTVFVAKEN